MDYEKQKEKALQHAETVKLRQELHELKHSNDKQKEKLSFSKVAFIFMISNCTVIEIYALIAMTFFADLSPLTSLIAAVVGECMSFLVFELKSSKENTEGGIIYESAMKKLEYELKGETKDTDEAVGLEGGCL